MKVLIINVQIGKGSVGQIVREIYKGVISSGNECKIAYARGDSVDIPSDDTIKIGNKNDQYLHAINSRVFGKTATYSKSITKKFLEEVDAFSPDVISIHGIYGYYINMPLLFNYIADNNIVLFSTLHSCWDFTGHCCYFDYVSCEEWKRQCDNCIQKKSYPPSYFFENSMNNLQMKNELYHKIKNCTIITPSNWMKRLVKESILKDINTITIHNGVDLNVFKPIHNEEINDKPLVLCIASIWEPRKGLSDIYEFYEYAKEKIELVVIGLNDKQIKSAPNGIIAMKRTSNIHELIDLYSRATVFFNPTYEDNYPTVNLEAIACNTPVITYDTGGTLETINYEQFGKIVEKKDFKSILEIIEDIFYGRLKFDFSDLNYVSNEHMVESYIETFLNCKNDLR